MAVWMDFSGLDIMDRKWPVHVSKLKLQIFSDVQLYALEIDRHKSQI